jgi:pimeloyl-ACP methyl ester carboxylesterase
MILLRRVLLGILLFLLVVVLVGPFLVPVRPLTGLLSSEQLADPDSKFIELNGERVHYKIAGSGGPLIILLHGFSASTYSWNRVLEPLARHGTVVAYDRPAAGLTARPLRGEWKDANPYTADAQADQVAAMIEALGFEQAILVGNSAGGAIAMQTYLRHPDRVQALVMVDSAIYTGGGAPGWIKPLLRTPQMDRLGPLISRSLAAQGDRLLRLAWHDPAKVTPEDVAGYRRATGVQNWDQALWEFTLASRDLKLGEQVKDVRVPTLVITGDDDRIVPTEQSLRLARELPGAELVVIPNCGHVPQEECPEAFLKATTDFLTKHK